MDRAHHEPPYGNRRRSVLLTNASRRLSGDQDGTLIVPCPPYRYATTPALPRPSRVDTTRRYTCLQNWRATGATWFIKDMKAIDWPSGATRAHQWRYRSVVR